MSGAPTTATAGCDARDERELRKEVVAWTTLLCSGTATEADQRAWQQWHQCHPDHQQAWQRFESMRALLQQVPPQLGMVALQPSPKGRRQALRSVLLLASGGALGYAALRGVQQTAPWQAALAEYRTGVGQQRTVRLADGALLILNTDSAVDVDYGATERTLLLRGGEILVETAHRRAPDGPADSRPLLVRTGHGSVQALGTRFTVRRRADATEVTVLADAVAVRATRGPASPVLLRAGQYLSFSGDRVGPVQVADDTAAAWLDGSIVVGDWPLGRLVAELDRYRPGRLACDPAVAGLRVSGAFPVADTDQALAVLARSLPVRVRRLTRYWVTIGPA